jgi:argininosuccinate synthase
LPQQITIGFDKGIPVTLNDETLDPVALIEALELIGGSYGIGRGIHVGDTVLGTKGRVAFEAPAADILINAHRELEKLTLSALQMQIKEPLANTYGDFVHYGKQLDPACRDIEALLESSQAHVTGEVKIMLRPGNAFVEGVTSPYSLMAATKGVYGEAAGEWTPEDALGFSRILALPGMLQSRATAGDKDAS